MANKESDLLLIMDKFAEASHLFSLTISLGKTEVLLQPATGSNAILLSISIEGITLITVEEFECLGSVISSNGSIDKDISAKICKGN